MSKGLYIRVGQTDFKKLSKDQIWKMKKTAETRTLVRSAIRAASSLRGLIAWMEVVERRGHRIGNDIHILKLPNRTRLLEVVKEVEAARRKL